MGSLLMSVFVTEKIILLAAASYYQTSKIQNGIVQVE